MTVKIEVQGMEEVRRNMKKLGERYGDAFAKAAYKGGQLVRTDAIKSINQKSPGNAVKRSREGGGTYDHIAASAGYAPNKDTGRLSGSIAVEVTNKDVFVGTSVEHARDLEFGTSNMLARPFLNPALEKNRSKIKQMFRDSARDTTKRGVK